MEQEMREVVEAAISGDKDAYAKLLDHYMKDILCFAGTCLSPQDAEDVAQEVALKIYKKIHQLRDPDRFMHWMSAIVHNVTVNYVKKTYKTKHVNLDACDQELLNKNWSEIAKVELMPEDYMEVLELRETISEEIDCLPTLQRTCLRYHFLYEFKRSEIAKATGLTARQVSTGLNYGKKTLKSRLEQRLGTQFTFSMIPVGVLPLLSQMLQAEQVVTVSSTWSAQVTSSCLKHIGHLQLLLPQRYLSKLKHLRHGKLVMGASTGAAVAVTAAAIAVSPGIIAPEEAASTRAFAPVVTTASTAAPIPQEQPIKTLADMIGKEEAEQLEGFLKGAVNESAWRDFLKRIDARRDESASELVYEYTIYILEKQDKRLQLAEQKPNEGGIMQVAYYFDQKDVEPIKLTQIILQFTQ